MNRANQTLAEVNENVKVMMKMVFEGMNTPEEKEVAALTHGRSVDAVLADDHTLKQILAKQSKGRDEKGGARSKDSTARPKDSSTVDGGALALGDLKHELSQDIDAVLAENSKHFDQKFAAMELSLKEVTITIQRQSDRVIEEILAGVHAGPHEHIRDKVRLTFTKILSLVDVSCLSGHLPDLEIDGVLAIGYSGILLTIGVVGLEGQRKSDTPGDGNS